MDFDNYQHDLDSQEYVYESDFEIDDEEVDSTSENHPTRNESDKECWANCCGLQAHEEYSH